MKHNKIRMRLIPVILSMLLLLMTVLTGCGNSSGGTQPSDSGAQTTAVTERLSGDEGLIGDAELTGGAELTGDADQSGDEALTSGEQQSDDKTLTGDEKRSDDEGLTGDAEQSGGEALTGGREQSADEAFARSDSEDAADEAALGTIDEDGVYTSKDDVALYIYTYHKLPQNFITKKEAKKLGWTGGSLEEYAPGKCIGGDHFGNYEGLLPEDEDYYECDVDTLGKSKRGAKRIIYTDDGKVYYTNDHYESFVQLY